MSQKKKGFRLSQFLRNRISKDNSSNETAFSLPIKDNISDLMQGVDGRYKLLSRVTPVNGDLLSKDNLRRVSNSISSALSTFEGRVGIYISSEKVDIETNLHNIDKQKEIVTNDLKLKLLDEQKLYYSTMANKCKNVLNFYVALETSARNYSSAEQLLMDSFRSIKTELEASNIFSYQYKEHDIKELLYKRMNPEQSENIPYNQAWSLHNLYPQSVKRFTDGRNIEIENRLHRFFSISGYPLNVENYRWLRRLLKINGDINIAFTMTPKPKTKLLKSLSHSYDELNGKYLMADKEHIKEQYRLAKDSAKALISKISAENSKLYDVNVTIDISAKTIQELDTLTSSLESAIAACNCQCTELKYKKYEPFYTTLPILADNQLTQNNVWNFTNDDIGSMILFDSSEYMENKGSLIGENETSRGIVIVNYYNRNYNNSHMSIIADSGSGKTFFLMTDAIRNFPYNDWTFMFDLKGDLIFPWGKRFVFSATSGIITNPFHIRNAIIDTDNEFDLGKSDVGTYLSQKIMDVIVFFKWIIRNMDTDQESVLEKDIRDTYALPQFNLTFKSTELPEIFPTLSDLANVMNENIKNTDDDEEKKIRRKLLRALNPYIEGAYSTMFNGQTNWDFDPFTVFALSGLNDAVKAPLYDLLLKEIWQFCKKDGTKNPPKKRVYVDECHELVDPQNPQTLIFISQKMSKQGRGFGLSLITATQNLPDFLSIPKYGQAIIDNAYFKFFMRLGESDLPVAKSLYRFSDAEMKVIEGNNQLDKGTKGKGIFMIGSQRVVVQTRASKEELEIVDPVEYEKIYGVPSRYFGSFKTAN